MGNIFKGNGSMAAIASKNTPVLMSFPDGDAFEIMVENASASAAEDYQLMRAFDGETYVTTFGPAMEVISLAGVYTPNPCSSASSGSAKLRAFFESKKPSTGSVLSVTIGDIAYRGVLHQMTLDPQIEGRTGNKTFRYKIIMLGQVVS